MLSFGAISRWPTSTSCPASASASLPQSDPSDNPALLSEVRISVVVFWLMGSPPSCRPAYRWLGEQRGEALFCALPPLEALVGSEDQRFNQRLRLLTTRFPTGCDGEAPLQRCRRKASQRHERRGHEHQTPMFSHGCSVAPALLVQAQRGLTVLIQSLSWPAWQRQGEDPLRLSRPPDGSPTRHRCPSTPRS